MLFSLHECTLVIIYLVSLIETECGEINERTAALYDVSSEYVKMVLLNVLFTFLTILHSCSSLHPTPLLPPSLPPQFLLLCHPSYPYSSPPFIFTLFFTHLHTHLHSSYPAPYIHTYLHPHLHLASVPSSPPHLCPLTSATSPLPPYVHLTSAPSPLPLISTSPLPSSPPHLCPLLPSPLPLIFTSPPPPHLCPLISTLSSPPHLCLLFSTAPPPPHLHPHISASSLPLISTLPPPPHLHLTSAPLSPPPCTSSFLHPALSS